MKIIGKGEKVKKRNSVSNEKDSIVSGSSDVDSLLFEE